jgi:hypothetical protein
VSAPQLNPEPPVGWIQTAGPFENFDALLKVTAHAALLGGLNHPVQGTGGNQLRSFHPWKILEADALCASSLCKG